MIVVCLDSTKLIMVRLSPSNTNNTVKLEHIRSNTDVRAVRAEPARHRFIHYSSACGQHTMRVGLRPRTTSKTNNTFKFKRTRSNANALSVSLGPTIPYTRFIHSTGKDQRRVAIAVNCNIFG